MYSKFLFGIVFLSLIVFIVAHGQEGSRNLTAEYCANNWKVDPVRCSAYVPKDYQSSQSQVIQQSDVQSNSANNANRVCPYGSYLGKDTFGNQACLDSNTNQVVSSPNLPQSASGSTGLGNNGTIAVIVVAIIIIAVIAGIAKSRGKSETQKLPRRGWSPSQRSQILARQGGRCAECGEYSSSGSYHFDHIDNNHNNNDLDNGQALCPNCHDRKSRDLD